MFAINNFAKVWKIYPKKEAAQKFTLIQMSTSKKTKTGYETDFSANVSLVSDAEKKASTLEAGDRIKLTRIGVTNYYNKQNGNTTVNYMIFDFEFGNENKQKEVSKTEGEEDPDAWMTADINEEDLPFK